MIDNRSYILKAGGVPAGESVLVVRSLTYDYERVQAPIFPEGVRYTLYEMLSEDNKHIGWRWEPIMEE